MGRRHLSCTLQQSSLPIWRVLELMLREYDLGKPNSYDLQGVSMRIYTHREGIFRRELGAHRRLLHSILQTKYLVPLQVKPSISVSSPLAGEPQSLNVFPGRTTDGVGITKSALAGMGLQALPHLVLIVQDRSLSV